MSTIFLKSRLKWKQFILKFCQSPVYFLAWNIKIDFFFLFIITCCERGGFGWLKSFIDVSIEMNGFLQLHLLVLLNVLKVGHFICFSVEAFSQNDTAIECFVLEGTLRTVQLKCHFCWNRLPSSPSNLAWTLTNVTDMTTTTSLSNLVQCLTTLTYSTQYVI